MFAHLNENKKGLLVLQNYNCYEKGTDRGIIIREKLTWLLRILEDRETLQEEQSKATMILNNMVQMSSQAVSSTGTGSHVAPESPTSVDSPGSRSKPRKRPEKLSLTKVGLDADQDFGESFVDPEDSDATNHVHLYSVPNNKSDFGFFKGDDKVATPKRSQNDNVSSLGFIQLWAQEIASGRSCSTSSRKRKGMKEKKQADTKILT